MSREVAEFGDPSRAMNDHSEQRHPRRRDRVAAERSLGLSGTEATSSELVIGSDRHSIPSMRLSADKYGLKATSPKPQGKAATPRYMRPRMHLASLYHSMRGSLVGVWRWLQRRRRVQLAARRMSICETVSFGEKRFLAVVKVDRQQFLVGGASNTVCLLTRLENARDFPDIFHEECNAVERMPI